MLGRREEEKVVEDEALDGHKEPAKEAVFNAVTKAT